MLPPETSTDGPNESVDPIAKIIDALRRQYGDEAIAIAENQRKAASGDMSVTWGEVVTRLKA